MFSNHRYLAPGLARHVSSIDCPLTPALSPEYRGEGVRARHAFSLIEFTVVLALIGLLAGVVAIGVRPMLGKGKQQAARAEIATIVSAVESFYTVYGSYPTNDEGIDILTRKTEKLDAALLQSKPVDPWGREYVYNQPGRDDNAYEVICLGQDGREGGTGLDEDIVSWALKEKVEKASAR